MAEQLTKQQKKAVDDRGGALLVSAAAGSGKTKVLVDRVMKYITDPNDPVNIDDFLVITYTKAAASELRAKIAKALTQRISEDPSNMRLQQQFRRLYLAQISTVHSFCGEVLREFAPYADIPGDFRMIEAKEDLPLRLQVLERLLNDSYDALGTDPDFTAFVDSQGVGRDDSAVPQLILKVYDSAKCHMDSEGWLQECIEAASADADADPADTIWGKYLIEDTARQASYYLQAVTSVKSLCDTSTGLEKMSAALELIREQLERICNAQKWDDIHNIGALDVGSITGLGQKKNIDKALYADASLIRERCKKKINKLLERFGDPAQKVMEDLRGSLPAVRGLIALVREFGKRYSQVKRSLRVMDFSDLEHKVLDLFVGRSRSGATQLARQVGQRYCQIMVDEYQDSNEVQDAIFNALTQQRNNLFMVGDVKQSIYKFRLADPGIFLGKYDRFVPSEQAEPGQGRKIILSNNFRSSRAVIDGVNAVFSQCMCKQVGGLDYGEDEALVEGGEPKPALPDPAVELHVIEGGSDVYGSEAEFVADRIVQMLEQKQLVREGDTFRPVRPDDIAILLRSPKTNGFQFHEALNKRGIATVSSVNIDLLTTDEVEWLRSLLMCIQNPRRDISLIATVTGPVFGFTANDLAEIRLCGKYLSFYDAMLRSNEARVVEFVKILNQLREYAKLHTLPQIIEEIFMLSRADLIYGAMPDGRVRTANLQEFYQFVVRYSAASGADISQLLEYLSQSEADGLRVERKNVSAGCVQITSIHKSKGLEYPVVFLCGLSKDFNLSDSYEKLLCDESLGIGLYAADKATRFRHPTVAHSAIAAKIVADTVSEELRVLYVAMTRPKDRLIMTYTVKNAADDLIQLATLMDHCPPIMLISGARCLGDWVLYTAMGRTDAGQLFVNSRKPANTAVADDVWCIGFHNTVSEDAECVDVEAVMPSVVLELEEIRRNLSFSYPKLAATTVPSKQTATQKKGRLKDREVAENAPAQPGAVRHWREAGLQRNRPDGKTVGNATHMLMQHIRFCENATKEHVEGEIQRLIERGFLTAEQAKLIESARVAAFFSTELGRLLCSGKLVREFKFSILDDASEYAPDVTDEQVLLQGVVDCALLEDDGITVVDFKTDRVTEETVDAAVLHYSDQVQTYANALSRIFELPIKAKALHFFAINKTVYL